MGSVLMAAPPEVEPPASLFVLGDTILAPCSSEVTLVKVISSGLSRPPIVITCAEPHFECRTNVSPATLSLSTFLNLSPRSLLPFSPWDRQFVLCGALSHPEERLTHGFRRKESVLNCALMPHPSLSKYVHMFTYLSTRPRGCCDG